jgi:NADH-quinone oxidoreductase subunit C
VAEATNPGAAGTLEPPVEAAAATDAELARIAGIAGVRNPRRALGELTINADKAELLALMHTLRDEVGYAQVMDICGVDWPDRTERFDVVYNLLCVTRNARLRVIVEVGETLAIASVSSLWPVATWWEREVWDLFGIPFEGLLDHRRILTDYGFEGHPMRKDFPLTGYVEVHYDEERKEVVYDRVRLTQEFRNFDFLSPWEGMTSLPGDEKARGDRR